MNIYAGNKVGYFYHYNYRLQKYPFIFNSTDTQFYVKKYDFSGKKVTTLPDNAILYFDESSTFPRLKIKDTKYKETLNNVTKVYLLNLLTAAAAIKTQFK